MRKKSNEIISDEFLQFLKNRQQTSVDTDYKTVLKEILNAVEERSS
jgi:hypothetical protein